MVTKASWRKFRALCRSINPDAYITGEVWWEEVVRKPGEQSDGKQSLRQIRSLPPWVIPDADEIPLRLSPPLSPRSCQAIRLDPVAWADQGRAGGQGIAKVAGGTEREKHEARLVGGPDGLQRAAHPDAWGRL